MHSKPRAKRKGGFGLIGQRSRLHCPQTPQEPVNLNPALEEEFSTTNNR